MLVFNTIPKLLFDLLFVHGLIVKKDETASTAETFLRARYVGKKRPCEPNVMWCSLAGRSYSQCFSWSNGVVSIEVTCLVGVLSSGTLVFVINTAISKMLQAFLLTEFHCFGILKAVL